MTEFLRSQGFKYELDEDGDLYFKYQMRNFLYYANDDDQGFFQMAMPAIFDVTEDNREAVLEAVNSVTASIKVAKAVILGEQVLLFAELLLDSTPVYDDIVPRVLAHIAGSNNVTS